MNVLFNEARNRYYLLVPANLSETGKRQTLYFKTEKEAEVEAQRLENENSDPAHDITREDIALLKLIKSGKSPTEVLEAIKFHDKTVGAIPVEKRGITLEKACTDFVDRQNHEGRNWRTVSSDRQALKRLCAVLGADTPLVEVTAPMLDDYIAAMKPGTTRRSQYARIKKFITWAWRSHYIAVNPWEKSKPLDKWRSNSERIKVEHYRRILFCVAGLEPFKEGEEPTRKYIRLLPFYILGGMGGMRRCELIDCDPYDPVIEWTDILWNENLIHIRDKVAKQTQANHRQRYIPLTPQAKAWLSLVRRDSGRIIDMSQSTLQRLNDEFLDTLNDKIHHTQKVILPNNGLRNSYASYRQSFDSPGEVAKAMGDLESTIRRFYVGQALKPETGRAWFAIAPGQRKIIPIGQAA
jgi:integrase